MAQQWIALSDVDSRPVGFQYWQFVKIAQSSLASPFPEESIVVKEKKTSREAKKAPAKSMKEKRAAKAAKKG